MSQPGCLIHIHPCFHQRENDAFAVWQPKKQPPPKKKKKTPEKSNLLRLPCPSAGKVRRFTMQKYTLQTKGNASAHRATKMPEFVQITMLEPKAADSEALAPKCGGLLP